MSKEAQNVSSCCRCASANTVSTRVYSSRVKCVCVRHLVDLSTCDSAERSSQNSVAAAAAAAAAVMPDQSWLQKLQTVLGNELFLIFVSNSNMLVKGEGGDFIFEDQNRDDDQVSDQDGDDASDKSHSESDEKDKDEDKADDDRFYPKSAMKKDTASKDVDNENEKYAGDGEGESLISLEEHLLLMESRLIEDISTIVREELAEFKRLFVSTIFFRTVDTRTNQSIEMARKHGVYAARNRTGEQGEILIREFPLAISLENC